MLGATHEVIDMKEKVENEDEYEGSSLEEPMEVDGWIVWKCRCTIIKIPGHFSIEYVIFYKMKIDSIYIYA